MTRTHPFWVIGHDVEPRAAFRPNQSRPGRGGNGLGLVATGRPVSFRGMTWLIIRDGKIVEGWDAWNQGALVQSLQAPGSSATGA